MGAADVNKQQDLPWLLKAPSAMSRETTDGKLLEWDLSVPSGKDLPGGGTLPFLIDWKTVLLEGLHPAATSPKGCSLLELVLYHPQPAALKAALQSIGLGEKLRIHAAAEPSLAMVLDTPKGSMTLMGIDCEARL